MTKQQFKKLIAATHKSLAREKNPDLRFSCNVMSFARVKGISRRSRQLSAGAYSKFFNYFPTSKYDISTNSPAALEEGVDADLLRGLCLDLFEIVAIEEGLYKQF